MNPIYKFQLSAGTIIQQAFPIYRDDLAKDFEKESGQEFFRAKLSGKLTFESGDYTFITSKAFDTQFVLEIFISYNAGQSWTSYWRGTFWKTDCEFDDDARTVIVQPSVLDQYNDVLAGLDKEYNLIELAPEILPVKADKRPMIQVYVPGQSVIGCFLSGMWWEQECDVVNESDTVDIIVEEQTISINKLTDYLHFARSLRRRFVEVSGTHTPAVPNMFSGTPFALFGNSEIVENYLAGGYRFVYHYRPEIPGDESTPPTPESATWAILDSQNVALFRLTTNDVPYVVPYSVELPAVSGSGATGTVVLNLHDINVYSRFVCDTNAVGNVNTYEIPDDDLVPNNRNYKRVAAYDATANLRFSTELSETPTPWGLYKPGQYYEPPYIIGLPEMFPVARNTWTQISLWFLPSLFSQIIEESGRQPFTIRHAYPLASVISVLLAKIAPGLTHAATTNYSQFLYGVNLLGVEQTLLVTPKSNIVAAGYDQPAQKAPITLRDVLNMLRDCFRCYWFVDEQNRFRVEHIQYFRNGGSYSGTPVVGADLTTQRVSRNGKAWAFARDQYQFDKPAMAARYQFGWMDDVTQLFEGYPIDIISQYVNPDNIEQIDVSRFTSDIDYILLNPDAISNDGFVLLSAISDVVKSGSQSAIAGREFSLEQNVSIPAGMSFTVQWNGDAGIFTNNNVRLYINGENIRTINRGTTYTFSRDFPIYSIRIGKAAENVSTSGVVTFTITEKYLSLPYINFNIDGSNYNLQNAYVAFMFLQRYYAYDMPAERYKINNTINVAVGVKKLKTQQLQFPVFADPDLVQLVKTNLGNGVIEKLSVNLSSRTANATLKYDTE